MSSSAETGSSADGQEQPMEGGEQDINYTAGQEDQDGYEQKDGEDPEEMKRRVEEMEEELLQLSNMQKQVERQINTAADRIDENSIYVGQVDYEATPEELRAHFAPCGTLNRITIVCDKISGHPKGFAYIEFSNKESVDNALKLDDTLFKGRQLKVLPKRQNVPFATPGRGRGRGGFGRGGGRGYEGRGGRGGYEGRGGRGGYEGRGRGRGGYEGAGGRFGYGGRRGGGAAFRGRSAPAYYANSYY